MELLNLVVKCPVKALKFGEIKKSRTFAMCFS